MKTPLFPSVASNFSLESKAIAMLQRNTAIDCNKFKFDE